MMLSVENAKKKILSQDIYDISNTMFVSSDKEGVSEVEAFSRLFSISQRLAVYKALRRTHSLIDKIVTLRRINKSIDDKEDVSEPNEFFGELRRSEIFLEGEDINAIFDPLTPGDIFDFSYKSNGKKPKTKQKSFILITQPCDMVLRSSNGRRKTNVGVLVPVVEYKLSDSSVNDKKADPSYHDHR